MNEIILNEDYKMIEEDGVKKIMPINEIKDSVGETTLLK